MSSPARATSFLRTSFAFLAAAALPVLLIAGQSSSPGPQAPPAAQSPPASLPALPEDPQKEDGTPILSDTVVKACSQCHVQDGTKRMSRLSYRRTTPEGWQETIKRMVSLNSLTVTPEEAREVLRYLANHLGLAPEEARPTMFEAERRSIDYSYPDKATEDTCIKCHSMGRVISQRRTKMEWELLISMHRGYYPLVDFQAFRRLEPRPTAPEADGRPADTRQPYEKALAHLTDRFPLRSMEWSAWSANMRPPRLQGRWALTGYQPGLGPVYGEVTVSPSGNASDEFTTETRLFYARSGREATRTGRAVVYTGFQWRGRSSEAAGDSTTMREALFVERDWSRMWGRWFSGAYDEIGIDVTVNRIGSDPVVLGAIPRAIRLGTTGQQVRVFGTQLPSGLTAQDIDLGAGVQVTKIVNASPRELVLQLDVAARATPGARDLFVAGSSRDAAIVLYDTIDAIQVTPQAGMARIGGSNFPRGYQQFEASALSYGADGKADSSDDISLGIIDASWSVEELPATFDDDDRKYVGTIDPTGLFTPNVDGPNPERRGSRNNVGDVWVVASVTPDERAGVKKPLRARAHLIVTVPLYMKWDQPEVAR